MNRIHEQDSQAAGPFFLAEMSRGFLRQQTFARPATGWSNPRRATSGVGVGGYSAVIPVAGREFRRRPLAGGRLVGGMVASDPGTDSISLRRTVRPISPRGRSLRRRARSRSGSVSTQHEPESRSGCDLPPGGLSRSPSPTGNSPDRASRASCRLNAGPVEQRRVVRGQCSRRWGESICCWPAVQRRARPSQQSGPEQKSA